MNHTCLLTWVLVLDHVGNVVPVDAVAVVDHEEVAALPGVVLQDLVSVLVPLVGVVCQVPLPGAVGAHYLVLRLEVALLFSPTLLMLLLLLLLLLLFRFGSIVLLHYAGSV